jgi:FkbM family methyltransferase
MILGKLKPGDVFCDIGANVGIFSIYAAKKIGKAGRVVAFEPAATNFKVLKKNVFINNLKNVMLFPYALGEASKMGILHLDEDRSSFVKDIVNDMKKQRVKIFRGDEIIRTKGIPNPKVIKIDVEGYEYFVIKGLKKTLANEICEMVCCEIHPFLLPVKINLQK